MKKAMKVAMRLSPFQEPRPPKARSIADLLKLIDKVSTVLSEAYEAQRLVRRQIYPEKPPEGLQSTDAILSETDRNYNYGEGSNANLRHKLWQKQREKEERRKRNGR